MEITRTIDKVDSNYRVICQKNTLGAGDRYSSQVDNV